MHLPAFFRRAAACCCLAAAGVAQAQLIDDFRSGAGTEFSWPAMPMPAGGVFEHRDAAAVPGGTRFLAMQPSAPNGARPYAYLGAGSGGLFAQREAMPALTVSIGYGLDTPMNLDLGAQGALRLQLDFVGSFQGSMVVPAALSVTVYATTSNGAGLNPNGSAAEVLLAPDLTLDVPLASFFTNASTGVGVNWGDVDSLLFVINDSRPDQYGAWWYLRSISAVAAPVPEPAAWALFAAGGLLLALRRARRGAALAAALVLGAGAAQADELIVNVPGFSAGTADPQAYPLLPGTVLALVNPVLMPLPAGSYTLRDAWGLPGAMYDTWNFQSSAPGSWLSHYVAALQRPDGSYEVLVDRLSLQEPGCANHFCAWSTQPEAAAAFAATPAYGFTLASAGTVAFVSADHYLPDNLGGISLTVSAVPEPGPTTLLLAGLVSLAWLQRGRGARR